MTGGKSSPVRKGCAGGIVVLVVLLAFSTSALAQITGASILNLPLSTRSSAMGQSGVADRGDPANIFYNPANLVETDGVRVSASHEYLFPGLHNDVWLGHVTLGVTNTLLGGVDNSLGAERPYRLSFALTLAHESDGVRRVFTPRGVSDEVDVDQDYFALTAGAGTPITRHVELAIGLVFKRWSGTYFESFDNGIEPYDASAGMFDVGTIVSTSIDASNWHVTYALGASAVNLGSDIESPLPERDIPLPSWFRYGTSVLVEGPVATIGSAVVPTMSATLNLEGMHGLNEQRPEWGFGFEVEFLRVAAVRFGRRIDDRDRTPVGTWGVALGAPAGRVRARIEYAHINYWNPFFRADRDEFGLMLAWLFDQQK